MEFEIFRRAPRRRPCGSCLYGTYVNWATTLLSGLTGAGAKMLPLGGAGHHGPAWAEAIVPVGLLSLSAAMLVGVSLVVWGAARNVPPRG